MVDPDPRRLQRVVRPTIEAIVSGERRWPAQTTLTLPPQARSFRVDFNELRQLDAEQARFRYRLQGFDAGWIDAGARRSAYYTKVPPGDYRVEVQAWAGGDWSETTATLPLHVQPYLYETTAFRMALVLAAMGLAYLAYRARVGWLQRQRCDLIDQVAARTRELAMRKEAAEQQARVIAGQAEQLRILDQQKSRFFDDLAHELRTPLTLILGPLRDAQRENSAGAATPAIEGAIHNGELLLDLTNQLLDLARLESGKFPLDRRREDLVALLRASAERFRPLAASRGVAFHWQAPDAPVWAELDLRHAGKIFDNLLSNAFKFTPAGGRVALSVNVESDDIARIDVADTGSGIAPEHLPHVFERFHHSDEAGARLQPGTGIGLALVHDLTQLHEGSLQVRSAPGVGTVFSVRLPLYQAAVCAVPVDEELVVATPDASPVVIDAQDETGFASDPDRTTILVVDDHAGIRAHVRQQLTPLYRVLEAADGIAALALARERLPDLIVADVSMPELDGYGLCAQIRRDPELDWLPVILLTARAGLDDRLEGLRAAADDYLTKPFDAEELRTRVDNLIAQRRRLRERFAAVPDAADAVSLAVTAGGFDAAGTADGDAGYHQRLLATIRARMADETFKVATLADAMNQDRSHLFRRVREVTGLAPSDLIRDLRLERAADLLRTDAGSISEIACAVGFSSVAYFTKCFRERYDRTPGQARGIRVTPVTRPVIAAITADSG